MLVNVFLYDMKYPHSVPTSSPQRLPFIRELLPQLQLLLETAHPPSQAGGESEGEKGAEAMEAQTTLDKESISSGAAIDAIKLQVGGRWVVKSFGRDNIVILIMGLKALLDMCANCNFCGFN